eukprot:m.1039859 g.1039859  ORF g.1039859 m.1039859 type:complete len:573 (-) comp24150_c2_seq11:2285-4003(-)
MKVCHILHALFVGYFFPCSANRGTQDIDSVKESLDWQVAEQAWYILYMQGIAAGTLHTATMVAGNVTGTDVEGCADSDLSCTSTLRYKTTEDMSLQIARGTDNVELKFFTEMTETYPAGDILHCGYTQKMAQDAVNMSYTFRPSGIEVLSEQGDRQTTSIQEPLQPRADGRILGRKAARDLFLRGLHSGVDIVQYLTVKPELGTKVLSVVSELQSFELFTLEAPGVAEGGKTVNTSVWLTRMEGVPIEIKEWVVHATGEVVRLVMDTGTGPVEARISSKEQAATVALAAGADGQRPELVDSTNFVLQAPDQRLLPWAGSTAAKYHVWSTRPTDTGRRALTLPSAGYQRSIMLDDTKMEHADSDGNSRLGGFHVHVNIGDTPVPALAIELREWKYIEPSAMLDANDSVIVALAERAFGGSRLHRTPDGPRTYQQILTRASILRRAAKTHFRTFNLKSGHASASEAARSQEGDCSEHAALLAALLRADGVPSRVCSGLVYTERDAEGRFAWHAWTQALVGTAWVDLDATMHEHDFSVGHILMGTSALDDATGHADELALVSAIGNLGIRVVSVL